MHIADARLGLRHVFLREMLFEACIGVYAAEQGRTQRIRVSVDLGVTDDGAAGLSGASVGADDLARVVDYAQIAGRVQAVVAAGHVKLVETLAERLAEACLEDRRVLSARVRVEKLEVLPHGASAGVEVERRRAV
jgi:dihydroneopterin aldolase